MSLARVDLPVHSPPVTTILIGVPGDVFILETGSGVRLHFLFTMWIIEYGWGRSRDRFQEQEE